MKSVRIYKDDIRVHILRSLFFTDTALVVLGTVSISILLYLFFRYVLHTFILSYYISGVIVGTIFFIAFITQNIDNQPIYKVIPRLFGFKASKKEKRFANLESYFTDFKIQDGAILRNGSLIRLFEIEPFDVALLNEQDRENFFIKLKQAIHVLPSGVQLMVRKVKAKPGDYSRHFFSLFSNADSSREQLIDTYIKDLSKLVESDTLFITKHYAVFTTSCNTNKSEDLVRGMKRLQDMGFRFASALTSCNITVRPLENQELAMVLSSTLRP